MCVRVQQRLRRQRRTRGSSGVECVRVFCFEFTNTYELTHSTHRQQQKPHECALTKQPANSIKQDFMHPVAVGDGDAFFCQSCRRSTLNSALWRAFTSYFHGVANDLHACAAAADREDDFSFMIRLAAPASPCTALLLLLLLSSVCALARLRNIWISGLRTMCVGCRRLCTKGHDIAGRRRRYFTHKR